MLYPELKKNSPVSCVSQRQTVKISINRVSRHLCYEREFASVCPKTSKNDVFGILAYVETKFQIVLLYGSVSQGLGTAKFTNLIG